MRLWPRGVQTYYHWLRESIATNKPYDQLLRKMITANGSNFQVGAANYYRAVQKREPQTYAEATSVLFLGVRLECARCHGHPVEDWNPDRGSVEIAAFFSKVAIKATQEWKEEVVFARNPHGGVGRPERQGLRRSEVFWRGPSEPAARPESEAEIGGVADVAAESAVRQSDGQPRVVLAVGARDRPRTGRLPFDQPAQ